MRQGLVSAAGTAAIVAAFLALGPAFQPEPNHLASGSARPSPLYEIISDEELLTQLHDRPLLIVQNEDGTKELVLLDR